MVSGYFSEGNLVPSASVLNRALSQRGMGPPPEEWAKYRGMIYIDKANYRVWAADGDKWILKVGVDFDGVLAKIEHSHPADNPTNVDIDSSTLQTDEAESSNLLLSGDRDLVKVLENRNAHTSWVITVGLLIDFGTKVGEDAEVAVMLRERRAIAAIAYDQLFTHTIERDPTVTVGGEDGSRFTLRTYGYVLPQTEATATQGARGLTIDVTPPTGVKVGVVMDAVEMRSQVGEAENDN